MIFNKEYLTYCKRGINKSLRSLEGVTGYLINYDGIKLIYDEVNRIISKYIVC